MRRPCLSVFSVSRLSFSVSCYFPPFRLHSLIRSMSAVGM
jgi:hypothetical protein